MLSKHQMKRLFEQYEKSELLKPQERKILSAALELKNKIVGDVMTNLGDTFMIDINANLDKYVLRNIYN